MKGFYFFLICISPLLSFGQVDDLQKLRSDYEIENKLRLDRIDQYSKANNIPIIQKRDFVTIYLEDIVNGKPHALISKIINVWRL